MFHTVSNTAPGLRQRHGRPATSLYAIGAFIQDHEFVACLGDLDDCNGRASATPEFPNGIDPCYATNTYPYFQRCVRGKV